MYLVGQIPYWYSNSDDIKTNKWLFQEKIPKPENFALIVVLVFHL